MDTSTSIFPVARKEHTCDWCLQKIQIGEAYRKQTIFDNGTAYTWKNHRHCDALANRLKMFENCNDGYGLTQEDFSECITIEFQRINDEKNIVTGMPEFKKRMEIVRIHHDL